MIMILLIDVRFKMKVKMRNQEGKEVEREVHTKLIKVRLNSGAEMNKFFKRIDEECTIVFRRVTSENFLRNIDEDVLNPEVKMNREDYNEGNSWDYWSIYAIENMTVEIQFPFSKNNSTHVAQVMKGQIDIILKIDWSHMNSGRKSTMRRKKRTQNILNREKKMETTNAIKP